MLAHKPLFYFVYGISIFLLEDRTSVYGENENIEQDEIINDDDFNKPRHKENPNQVRLAKLKIMAEKYDADANGKITVEELDRWVDESYDHYINKDSDSYFSTYDMNNDGKVTWKEYRQSMYGFLTDEQLSSHGKELDYARMLHRDKRRWSRADQNNDDICTKEEFRAFIHPEEFEHSKELFSIETLENMDKNNDGFVDVDEYLSDLARPGKPEPNWIPNVRKEFLDNKDLDGDGKMNLTEVSLWIMPGIVKQSKAEAEHLIYVVDENKDDELTFSEILAHHDTFAMSMATQWGDALKLFDKN